MPRRRLCGAAVCGGVGAQYTPAAGWAQALRYRRETLKERATRAASPSRTAAKRRWPPTDSGRRSHIATTLRLPMLFYIEDNGYRHFRAVAAADARAATSPPILRASTDCACSMAMARDPQQAAALIARSRARRARASGPALLRLTVPRLEGHSVQDTQTYKIRRGDRARSRRAIRCRRLRAAAGAGAALARRNGTDASQRAAQVDVEAADRVERRGRRPTRRRIHAPCVLRNRRGRFADAAAAGRHCAARDMRCPRPAASASEPQGRASTWSRPSAARSSRSWRSIRACWCSARMSAARAACRRQRWDCRTSSARERVFDTSLSEEGIIGRAVGMALAGLMPVPEIQFRKYADPAAEQLNDCGTMRWRTSNRFAAPDRRAHARRLFQMRRSLAQPDQRSALRARARLAGGRAVERRGCGGTAAQRAARQRPDDLLRASRDARWRLGAPALSGRRVRRAVRQARRRVREGSELTIVTLGRDGRALRAGGATSRRVDAEILDLRTLLPWDRDAVLASVRKTHRCLIVHEDNLTAGFGAEIAAVLVAEGLPRSRCAGAAAGDARHSQPAQSASARGRAAERDGNHARHPRSRELLKAMQA